ncbi:Protein of uncharacterised function (DUF421) [Legionella busanensis]|uniref:Protein of uncharacterized function (DUF421) n=1 Tax=Legionella busanensis TaxID=190655 RepID=A0A378JT98_9GAMM|nr:YetF domain-containing protein [Legionella busanensis]STX51402.1 Protein of uncharacterised function (DUF421) [Legionella busanensis]
MIFDFLSALNESHDLIYIFLRAILLFLFSVIFFRFGNHRYNLNTVMDTLLIITLGSLIGRGINGPATLMSTLVATITLVILHKLLAKLTFCFPQIESLFKGKAHLLIENGKVCESSLACYNITYSDLEGAIREQLNTDDIKCVKYGFLERSGKITFIKYENK